MSAKAEIVITALDKASATINRIAERFEAIGKPITDIGKRFENVQKSFERLGNASGITQLGTSLGTVGERISNLGGKLRTLAVVGGGAIIGLAYSFKALEGQLGDFEDQLANAGIRGQAVVNLRAQADAMSFFGVKAEDATAAVVKLTQNQSAALAGSKAQREAFAAAGVSMEQLKKLSPDQLFEQLANNFSKSEKSGAKLNVAMALMGKSSTKMVEALSAGPESFAQFKEKYKDALLTEKDFNDLGKAGDIMDGLTLTMTRIGQKMAAVAAPRLMPILEQLESRLLAALPGMMDRFASVLDRLNEESVTAFFEGLASAFNTVVAVFSRLHSILGTTGMVFAALAVAFGPTLVAIASLLVSLGPVFGALMKIGTIALPLLMKGFAALSALVLANPIVASIAAVIAVVALLYNRFESVRNIIDGIGSKIAELWTNMPSWLGGGGSVNVNATQANQASNQAAAAVGASRGGRADVGGRIVVDVNDQRTTIREVASNNRDVPIEANAGVMGVA